MGHMKATTFGTKEEDTDDNGTNINQQQNNKGEEAKGGWVLCFVFFFLKFCFMVGPFFF